MRVLLARDGDRCIYCREDSTTSTKRAHVFPQAIMANESTLPTGVECDACNEFHGRLEQVLLHHNRIGLPAMFFGAPGKRGRPRSELRNVVRQADGSLRALGVAKHAKFREGKLEIEYDDPAPMDHSKFRRALGHIALNYLAFRCGSKRASDGEFDPIRSYVRRGTGGPWPYVQFQHDDSSTTRPMGLRLVRTDTRLIVQIRTFVDDFYVDLHDRDAYLYRWAHQTLPSGWLAPD